jgi:succinate-acetate transporter protein
LPDRGSTCSRSRRPRCSGCSYGLLQLLVATHVLATGETLDHAVGFWFIALAAITVSGTLGVLLEGNLGVTAVLGVLAAGSAIAAIGFLGTSTGVEQAAGWVFVVSAALAWYVATAMLLKAAAGRVVLPLFTRQSEPPRAIELGWAEPGVKQGQ